MKKCKRICVVLFTTIMMFLGASSVVFAEYNFYSDYKDGEEYTIYAKNPTTIRYEPRVKTKDKIKEIRLAEYWGASV